MTIPRIGGRYLRDKSTGALTRVEPDRSPAPASPAAPAAANANAAPAAASSTSSPSPATPAPPQTENKG